MTSTLAEDESQIDHAAVQAAKDDVGGRTGERWAVRGVEGAAHFLSMATVRRATFSVAKGNVSANVVLESPAGESPRGGRVQCQASAAGMAYAVFVWHSFPGSDAPAARVDAATANAVSALVRHFRPRLAELAEQARAAVEAAKQDESVIGPVREKLARVREKLRERGVAKVRKAIEDNCLLAEDVTRAWDEHVVREVLKS